MGIVLWLVTRLQRLLTGTEPGGPEPEDTAAAYDFREDSSFAELMQAGWFQSALEVICSTEAENEAALMRKYVNGGNLDEARRAEAAMQVFEDLNTIFKNYAAEYRASRKA
jgi:hypothetical protein